jgi:hypothetical protein
MHAAFGGGADRKGLQPQYLAGGLLYTQNRLGSWMESDRRSTTCVLRHLGVSQEESKAYVEALSSTFDVAVAPCSLLVGIELLQSRFRKRRERNREETSRGPLPHQHRLGRV